MEDDQEKLATTFPFRTMAWSLDQTTQLYINMARQMDAAVASLHVPDVLKKVNCELG
jgi:hypothetical protein